MLKRLTSQNGSNVGVKQTYGLIFEGITQYMMPFYEIIVFVFRAENGNLVPKICQLTSFSGSELLLGT